MPVPVSDAINLFLHIICSSVVQKVQVIYQEICSKMLKLVGLQVVPALVHFAYSKKEAITSNPLI